MCSPCACVFVCLSAFIDHSRPGVCIYRGCWSRRQVPISKLKPIAHPQHTTNSPLAESHVPDGEQQEQPAASSTTTRVPDGGRGARPGRREEGTPGEYQIQGREGIHRGMPRRALLLLDLRDVLRLTGRPARPLLAQDLGAMVPTRSVCVYGERIVS